MNIAIYKFKSLTRKHPKTKGRKKRRGKPMG